MSVADLPEFTQIQPQNIETQLIALLDQNRVTLAALLDESRAYTWENLIAPLEDMEDKLNKFWSPVSHLNSVKNSDELRQAYNACIPLLSDYATEISHNKKLYEAIQSIHDSAEFSELNFAQQKVIQDNLRDFKLAGVALSQEDKKRFAALTKELSNLTTKFEENVLDATHGWEYHVKEESLLSGLPEHAVAMAAQKAQLDDKKGWVFTLEAPSYIAVMTHADDPQFREAMYRAYVTRASDQGPKANEWDNSEIMVKILQARTELAKLLGFKNYAEKSLATKMVKETKDVLAFLEDLAAHSKNRAKEEFQYLTHYAKEKFGVHELKSWDIAYYSEKLRQEKYNISQETLRPYFPEPKVLEGLFAITQKLFGVKIEQVEKFNAWDPSVKLFSILNHDGSLRAQFYIDLYARKHKRGGAWMDECRVRRKLSDGKIQIPVAYVTCNFNAPVGNDPALFTHDEVETLFHEFGHALQHMLTTVDYSDVSGINGIPWDAVEVASQCNENWAWEKEGLELITSHFKTGQVLPDTLYDSMMAAKNFQSAMQMVRQLEFSLFDFHLHMKTDVHNAEQIQHVLDAVRRDVSVVPVPEYNRFQHGFGHIFSGGYAAGYYSYKWAEVMAADAFSLFKQNGIFDRPTAESYLKYILEPGGSRNFDVLFREFRGRDPEVEALLEQTGIKE